MSSTEAPPDRDLTLAERLRITTETLELIADKHGTLALLPDEDRIRLRQAVAQVYNPDVRARRSLVKAITRKRKQERVAQDEEVLSETGIRALRRQTVFTTPNIYAPKQFQPNDLPPSEEDAEEASARELEGATSAEDVPADAISADAVSGEAVSGDAVSASGAAPRETLNEQCCYICKQHYVTVHHFYDRLCPACGDLNFFKRTELTDLRGRVALLTGGRVKIGYQAGLKLLRAGAHLIVTTRFPRDAASRFAREPDFADWSDRVEVYGLDLRHTPSVEAFCHEMVATRSRLDFIINNACQTVRRPPEFYAHMMAGERAALADMPAQARRLLGAYAGGSAAEEAERALVAAVREGSAAAASTALAGLALAPELSQVKLLPEEMIAQQHLFPDGRLDADLQQVDLRAANSWRMLLADVSAVELLEVQLVNAVAPFILNARLKPLMLRTPGREKHIVNVSAVEGQFYRSWKTTRHPHTNMAKAALNMMTRTSAADYQADGIHMNSVDTGWVTDEDAAEIAARKVRDHRFHPPLDIVDGAARIVDPIIDGLNTGHHIWGQFLKDYKSTDW